MVAILLNMWIQLNGQTRSNNHVFGVEISTPQPVSLIGEGILIYSLYNEDSLRNYSIVTYRDSFHFRIDDLPLSIRPKAGVWYKPFCAYPLSEDGEIKASFMPEFNSTEVSRQNERTCIIKYNGISKVYKLLTAPGKISIPASGCIFNCKKLPTLFIFGDLSDAKNQFVVTFR